jgi:nitronate monooxygenase
MVSELSATSARKSPWLIQGGMGIAISGWPLARAVAQLGQLGVVSGTAIDSVFARRLQDNGVDGTLQEILDHFPDQLVVQDVLHRFASRKREPSAPYRNLPMPSHRGALPSQDLLVLSSFVEVALAKRGHDGLVGINLLTKVQIPTMATLYGALLADVDYVMMGAGVPTHIPGLLEQLVQGNDVELALSVSGSTTGDTTPILRFDPSRYSPSYVLRQPKFVAIVSSHVLATALVRRSNGPVDGFVVERPIAGGHNAPPRGAIVLGTDGGPAYGERDEVNFEVLRNLNVPFWIGGGVTSPNKVREAFELGATGVQVGTLFAYCQESGMDPHLREGIVAINRTRNIQVTTSMVASSTGYPFKVASIPGTIADPDLYAARERKCDLGYLREAYLRENGTVGYRCAAEPVLNYERKGGQTDATTGSTCLCNGLMATCGLGQVRSNGYREPPIVTSGDLLNDIRLLAGDRTSYSARDVVEYLAPGLDKTIPVTAMNS